MALLGNAAAALGKQQDVGKGHRAELAGSVWGAAHLSTLADGFCLRWPPEEALGTGSMRGTHPIEGSELVRLQQRSQTALSPQHWASTTPSLDLQGAG